MSRTPSPLSLALCFLVGACGASIGGSTGVDAGTGGVTGSGGGTPGTGGTGGGVSPDAPASDDDAAAFPDGAGDSDGGGGQGGTSVGDDGPPDAPASIDAGGSGDPAHQSGGPFVGPAIAADCPEDPTAGWTEYSDTFHVEHPYDLPEAQRFSFQDGIFTFWVLPTDKAHQPGNTTDPRTEARWSNFANSRPHLFSADMMFETPSNHTTIFQVHTTASGAGPVYLRVDDGDIHPLNGGVFVSGLYGKWFNLKVAIDPASLQATIWINNCQKLKGVIGPRGDGVNYFKNGVYTCTSSVCRDHYKNIHLYQK